MKDRINFLRKRLEAIKADGMIVVNKSNILYLTGLDCEGILIINQEYNIFLTFERFVNYAEKILKIESGVIVESIEKNIDFTKYFERNDTIAIEEKDITVRDYEQYKKLFKVNFKDASYLIEDLREVKTDEEIVKILYISEMLDEVLKETKRELGIGQIEKKVAKNIEEKLIRRGLNAVNIRVSFGKNTAYSYMMPTDNKLRHTDVIIIEISAQFEKYISTIGRTIFFGNVEKEYKDIKENYEKLYKIHDELLRTIKAKEEIRIVSKIAKEKLSKIAWNLNYDIGSGIGLEKEEQPFIHNTNLKKFKENMVINIRPQIYINEDYGLLISDTIKLTEVNFLLLTKTDRSF